MVLGKPAVCPFAVYVDGRPGGKGETSRSKAAPVRRDGGQAPDHWRAVGSSSLQPSDADSREAGKALGQCLVRQRDVVQAAGKV